jgi:hypothetical protein
MLNLSSSEDYVQVGPGVNLVTENHLVNATKRKYFDESEAY